MKKKQLMISPRLAFFGVSVVVGLGGYGCGVLSAVAIIVFLWLLIR